MSEIESEKEFKALEAEVMAEGFEQEKSSEAEKQQQQSEFMGGEQCAGLCHVVFAMIARRKGDKWSLKQEEALALGSAIDPVLAKYLPSIGKMSAELALLGALAAIILPRVIGDDEKTTTQPAKEQGQGSQ